MMQTLSRGAVALLASLLLSACGGDASPGAAASGGGTPPAAAVATPTSDLQADAQELGDYTLTMDELERWGTAAAAVARIGREKPELKDQLSMNASEASIDAFAERLEAIPEVRDAVEEAGFSPREYAVTTYVVVQSMLAQAAIQQGMNIDAIAAKAGINPANVTFFQQHEAEVRATFARVQGK